MNTLFDIREQVIDAYKQGLSLRKVSKKFGVGRWIIEKWLRSDGIEFRDRYRKLNYDRNYFSNIDSPDKAYILGLLTTDGCVSEQRRNVSIGLQTGDRSVLEEIKKAIGYDGTIKEYQIRSHGKLRSYVRLCFRSKQWASDLAKLTLTSRKTFTVKPWDGPSELMPHYWRGVIDGDGSVLRCKAIKVKRKACFEIKLVGNEFIVKGFSDYVLNTLGISSKPMNRHADAFGQRIGQYIVWFHRLHYLKKIAAHLYACGGIAIERKRAMAQVIIDEPITSMHCRSFVE